MQKILFTVLVAVSLLSNSIAQTMEWEGRTFNISGVKASIVSLNGEHVLRIERDLEAIPFDIDNLSQTVDEPTFAKIKDFNMRNGVFEVKVLSRILNPSPFPNAHGFIGMAFRINKDNSAFESIYLRPNVGRSESQFARNHTVQYFAYPDYKFDKLRGEEYKSQYESYADVGLDEWITMRFEIKDKKASLYLNDQKYPSFIVNEMLGDSETGSIGLYVDIGTEGYFKDLKIFVKN